MLVQQRLIGGDHRSGPGLAFPESVAFKAVTATAGFFQNQCTGRIVPEFLAAMQQQTETIGGQVTPFEGAGTKIALRSVGWGYHQSGGQRGGQAFEIDGGHGMVQGNSGITLTNEGLVVQPGPLPGSGGKSFAANGVVHRPQNGTSFFHQCDRQPEIGNAVNKVRRSIDGVHAPEPIVVLPETVLFVTGHFFPQHGTGVEGAQGHIKSPLGCQIRFRQQAAIGLAVMRDMLVTRQNFGFGDGS